MARIPRWTQKIFASGAANNGIFGSAQAGTKILSNSLADIQSLAAWGTGWLSATLTALKFPPLEERQAIDYLMTTQLAYLFQEGIPEYDSETTYYHYSIVKNPSTFQLYGSKVDNNTGNALPTAPTSDANWQYLIDLLNPISGGIVGNAVNAKMSVAAASATATFSADEFVVKASLGGVSQTLSSFSKTVNLATTGAGGMDTGTAPINGFVALYPIFGATGTSIIAVNTTSAVAPAIYGGAHMPPGYSQSGLASVWATDNTGKFVVGNQRNRTIGFPNIQVLSTSSPTSIISLSVAAAVPKNAYSLGGYLHASTASPTNLNLTAYSDANSSSPQIAGISQATAIDVIFKDMIMATAQTIYYSGAITTGTPQFNIFVSSYTF